MQGRRWAQRIFDVLTKAYLAGGRREERKRCSGGSVSLFPKRNRMLFPSNRSDVLMPYSLRWRSVAKKTSPRWSGLSAFLSNRPAEGLSSKHPDHVLLCSVNYPVVLEVDFCFRKWPFRGVPQQTFQHQAVHMFIKRHFSHQTASEAERRRGYLSWSFAHWLGMGGGGRVLIPKVDQTQGNGEPLSLVHKSIISWAQNQSHVWAKFWSTEESRCLQNEGRGRDE